jgi:hypothetical protein
MIKDEMRGGARSNVFLSATLNSGNRHAPVRIRNMSRAGALVDGPELPSPGTRFRLSRGHLSVLGTVAWSEQRQAGLNFESDVDVRKWTERVGHAAQQRVDAMIAAVRGGVSHTSDNQELDNGDTLPVLSAALDQVCRRLAELPAISLEVGEEMIKLDLIAQSLRRHARAAKWQGPRTAPSTHNTFP